MRNTTALFAVLLTALVAGHASAQQTVRGSWQAEQINTIEPPEGVVLTLTFADEGLATLSYSLEGGPAQSWDYRYAIEGSTLTLETTTAPGKAGSTAYEFRFADGKLQLLEPLPDPEEGQLPPPDNRQPVWVLSRP